MAKLLHMPEVAANATEAVLQAWQVAENQPFGAQDTIATVETEKAVVDVEAETEGTLLKTLVAAGAQVEVGSPIAVVGAVGETVEDLDGLLARLGVTVATPAGNPERREVPDVPGEGPDVPRQAPEAPAKNGRIFASPLARRLAKEAGLPVESLAGTGPRGRILRRDVEAAVAARGPDGAVPARQRPAPAAAEGAPDPADGVQEVPHSRMRRAIADRLVESKQTAPHFYVRATVRADELLRLRGQLNQAADVKISLNDLVVKAVGRAHTLVPEMNAIWTPEAVRRFASVDVGVAVATERGLVTPVLRGVDASTVTALTTRARDLAERAREGRLRQEELEGGTITVTNLGMYGTEEFAAIINPPQAAILAVGAARQEPVVDDGALAVGSVMRLTLSVDHRPVDGVLAARWMQVLVSLLETPARILA